MTAHTLKPFWPLLLALLVLVLMAAFSSCYMDNEEDLYPKDTTAVCDTTDVSYSATVKPIVTANCATAGCHAGSAPAAGYNLEAHAGLAAIATSGRLMGSIRHESGYSPMPKNAGKMPDCDINQIASWVAAGAPNN